MFKPEEHEEDDELFSGGKKAKKDAPLFDDDDDDDSHDGDSQGSVEGTYDVSAGQSLLAEPLKESGKI